MTKILLQHTQMHLRFLLFFQIKYALKIWDVNVHIIIITILDSCSLDFMSKSSVAFSTLVVNNYCFIFLYYNNEHVKLLGFYFKMQIWLSGPGISWSPWNRAKRERSYGRLNIKIISETVIAWSQQIICIVVEYSTKNLPILHNLSDKKVFTKEVAVNFGGPYIGSGAKV